MRARPETVVPGMGRPLPQTSPPRPHLPRGFCHLPSRWDQRQEGHREAVARASRAFQSRTATRYAKSPFRTAFSRSPAKQPDTLASAGDMGQVARSVLNSFSNVLPWKPHGPRMVVWSGFAKAGIPAPCQLRRKFRGQKGPVPAHHAGYPLSPCKPPSVNRLPVFLPTGLHSWEPSFTQSSQQAAVDQVV